MMRAQFGGGFHMSPIAPSGQSRIHPIGSHFLDSIIPSSAQETSATALATGVVEYPCRKRGSRSHDQLHLPSPMGSIPWMSGGRNTSSDLQKRRGHPCEVEHCDSALVYMWLLLVSFVHLCPQSTFGNIGPDMRGIKN